MVIFLLIPNKAKTAVTAFVACHLGKESRLRCLMEMRLIDPWLIIGFVCFWNNAA
jgi:hypothetical protein